METTVGKILLKHHVPEPLKPFVTENTLDKKGIGTLFNKLSEMSPDTYKTSVSNLARLGFEVSTRLGSTVPLADLSPLDDKDERFNKLEKDIAEINALKLPKKEKEQKLGELYQKFTKDFDNALMEAGKAKNHTLSKVLMSGARGSAQQYRATAGAVVLVTGEKGTPLYDYPIRNSFADGLTVPEYLLHSYGTREGTIGTKLCLKADTEVLMADFSIKKIQDIKVGELVMGADINGNTFPTKVNNVFDNGQRECYRYRFRKLQSHSDFLYLESTPDHKVLATVKAENKQIPVGEMEVGDFQLQTNHRDLSASYRYIDKEALGMCSTFDLEVEHQDHLFVLANGIIVSNSVADSGYMCYTGDTLIRMADFSTKRIDEIKVGDKVLGADKEGYTFSTDVTAVFDNGYKPVNEFKFRKLKSRKDFVSLKATDNHHVLAKIKRGKRYNSGVKKLPLSEAHKVGFRLISSEKIVNTKTGETESSTFSFFSKEYIGVERVYDFEVAHPDHLYVLANGVVSSNSKQLARSSMPIKVEMHDCETTNGIPVSTGNSDHVGSFLAKNVDTFKRNNEVTPSMLAALKAKGITEIVVRSPITCTASRHHHFAAVCQLCAGRREKGKLPEINDFIGLSAAAPLGEVLSQGMLNCLQEDTEVLMSDWSVKKIKDIKVGDFVMGSTKKGILTPTKVTNVWNQGLQPVYDISFRLGSTRKTISVKSTLEHKFLCNLKTPDTKLEPVGLTTESYSLVLSDGELAERNNEFNYLGMLQCYDLEVEHEDSLFVLANSMICSNSKHSSSSAGGPGTATGFKLIQQLANIPHTFQNKAAVAKEDGIVKEIKKLPQGGLDIIISSGMKNNSYYVPTGFEPKVKVNQHVEEGDILSEGLVNAADIVKHKGIGEGRRYYADMMYNAFKDSGMGVNHRNFQVVAKTAIDHVKVTHPEGLGNHLPDSIVSYQAIEKDYKPRPSSKEMRIDLAKGKYLEVPVLHYTIGTKITSSVVDYLKRHNVDSVTVNDTPPPFTPEMQRLLDVPGTVPDWAHQLYSTYLEKRLIKAVGEGMYSSLKGPSPILGLSYGVSFGEKRAEEVYEDEEGEVE